MPKGLIAVWTIASLFAASAVAAPVAPKVTTAILVDKKLNELHVTEYVDGAYRVVKTYHTTLGRTVGDKEEEGDLKTPEGIYTLMAKLTPPTLRAKFGAMAFTLNFPNTYDQLAGRTGSHIMLHATDVPARLTENYDSEGCVVLLNEQIREVEPKIRLGLTPILIFPELGPAWMKPGQDVPLAEFFRNWVGSWERKDIDAYIDLYHSDFVAQGMHKEQWKGYKKGLNSRYATISIGPEDVKYYRHPKYSMITFTQNYRSTLKGGGQGHRSRGTKILYVAEEGGKPKLIAETYTTLMW